ncbi:MAG: ABC transporter permease [Eubacteriales bacterium]|nr:ABC transporter permease [Eubacteriales bacterium]
MKKTYTIVIKKIVHMVFILLLLSLIVFSFIRLIPGDPVKSSLGPLASDETIAAYRHQLYFDRPFVVQWLHWLKGIITAGDFGQSLYTHRNVSIDIAQYLPRSLELCLLAAVLILVLGVLVGTVSALFKNTWVDNVVRFITYLGVVTPAYAFGIVFMLIFAYGLKVFPIGGFPDIPEEIIKTGAPALDSILSGDFALFGQCMRFHVSALPSGVLRIRRGFTVPPWLKL